MFTPSKNALRYAATAVVLVAFTGLGCDNDVDEVEEIDEVGSADVTSGSVVAANQAENRQAVAGRADGGEADIASESAGEGLTIEKKYPEKIAAGTEFTYTIDVRNETDGALRGVMLKEALPEGFAIKSSEPKATRNENGTLVFDLGTMDNDAAMQVAITGTAHTSGSVYACTTYDFERGVCVPFEVVNPNLTLQRNLSANSATVCDPVTLTYVVTNSGDTAASDVMLYEELPEGLAAENGSRVEFEIGELAPGQSVEKQVQVFPEQAGEYSSYAFAKSDLDSVESQAGNLVVVAPQLDVRINSPRDYVYIGDDARFEVVVTNSGEGMAHNVLVDIEQEGEGAITYIGNRGDAQMAGGEVGEGDADNLNLGMLDAGQSKRFFVEVDAAQEGEFGLGAVARAICERNRQGLRRSDRHHRDRRRADLRVADRSHRLAGPGASRRRDDLRDHHPERRQRCRGEPQRHGRPADRVQLRRVARRQRSDRRRQQGHLQDRADAARRCGRDLVHQGQGRRGQRSAEAQRPRHDRQGRRDRAGADPRVLNVA